MAPKRATAASASAAEPITATEPMPEPTAPMPDWLARAVEQGVKPEQALAFIGLGLMRHLADGGQDAPWLWSEEEDGAAADLAVLRQRLELVQLALDTGAPLSTAEVSQLLGARPGAAVVQRGGLRAKRLSRNVWKLSRVSEESERGGFSEGFRRRL
jgi:hypothetical protein